MTPDIELGEGVARLKNSVVNPGILHRIDIKKDIIDKSYINNGVVGGKCVLINALAQSLKAANGNEIIDISIFDKLDKLWVSRKRVTLNSDMNKNMYGVSVDCRSIDTIKRRLGDVINLIHRFIKEYGGLKVCMYSIKLTKRYGFKLMRQKVKNRFF
jgi:hypothetical protein